MKRVIIIGCPGSGKSTFARALHKKTGLPLCYLDMLYWNADRTTVEKSVFLERLQAVLNNDEWLIDGNYSGTLEMRLERCDTVFFFDLPTEVCLEGVYARRGKARPDMPWIEPIDSPDEDFVAFIKDYKSKTRPKVLELLKKFPEKQMFTFEMRADADEYLKKI